MQESAYAGSLNIRLASAAVRWTAVAFLADRVTKSLFRAVLGDGEWAAGPIPEIGTFVFHRNHGIVANLPVPQPVILGATVIIMMAIAWAAWNACLRGRREEAAALGLLLGGAVGNLADRALYGYVFDWLLLFGRSAVNLADIAIVIGAVWYILAARKKEPLT